MKLIPLISPAILILLFVSATIADEWQDVFPENNLDHWQSVGEDGGNWSVENGVLKCDGKPGAEWIASKRMYSDFELSLEYNLGKDGNSGVFLRAPLEGAPWVSGIEIQLLDDYGTKWKDLTPKQFTAAIYEVVAPTQRATKPAGTWQSLHIRCVGRDVRVTLNDQKVLDVNLDDYEEFSEKVPGLHRTVGHIGFQNHGDPMSIRKVRIKEIKSEPEKIALWNGKAPIGDGKFEEADAHITIHRPANPNGAAAVICPGGGYGGLVTGAEGHGIAKWLNKHGITGVVLEYRLPKGRSSVPLADAQRALRTVRAHASKWGVDSSRIGIVGFSAGGHLASTAGTHFDNGSPHAKDPIDQLSSRPDFMLLVYPVITMGEKTHGGSKRNLLGENPSAELVERFSNEKQITDKTPPAFLAHAIDDGPVPPENSRLLHQALAAAGVASKYLELPSGGHGLNGYKGPMWDAWQQQSVAWLAEQKIIPQP